MATAPKRKKSAIIPTAEKQEIYAEARASGLTQKDASAAAGYSTKSPVTGFELEKMPNVRALLNQKQRANAYMLGLTRDKVLEGMMEAIEQAKVLADPLTQIAGWREVAKVCGFYAPEVKKIELGKSAQGYLARLERMSDEELLEIANADVIDVEFEERQ